MANSVIIGAQWGDEGKAKVIDFLTEKADLIIRYQGGANAGHTVVVDGEKFVFHMVPSGIMSPDKICVITNGVVFDAEQFLVEVEELQERGPRGVHVGLEQQGLLRGWVVDGARIEGVGNVDVRDGGGLGVRHGRESKGGKARGQDLHRYVVGSLGGSRGPAFPERGGGLGSPSEITGTSSADSDHSITSKA